MMRDIKDSERIRTAIVKAFKPPAISQVQNLALSLSNLNTCILSKGYWDSMQNDEPTTDSN